MNRMKLRDPFLVARQRIRRTKCRTPVLQCLSVLGMCLLLGQFVTYLTARQFVTRNFPWRARMALPSLRSPMSVWCSRLLYSVFPLWCTPLSPLGVAVLS